MTQPRRFVGLLRLGGRSATARLHTLVWIGASTLGGCTDHELTYNEHLSEATVGSYVTTSCTTSVVIGLSKQIAEEIGCMDPDSMVSFTPAGNLRFTSNAVLPYLSAAGKADLLKVAETRVVQVNSGFRTVAQQYLLYRWDQTGRCGIPVAATPGTSNHESGRALDLQNYSELVGPMADQSWSHSVPGDPVHFDHLGSPDIRGRDVLAFQRLWNRNNPGDQIAEDGDYGPATASRLDKAPATGFAVGAECAAPRGAEVVAMDGPDKVAPGTTHVYRVTIANKGTVDWPATTKIYTAGGEPSEMYDADTWVSPTEVGTLGTGIAAGGSGTIDIHVDVPQLTERTPLSTELRLDDEGTKFGSIIIAFTVTLDGDEDTSGDGDDANDTGEVIGGACSTGRGSASWLGILFALAFAVRRRLRS